MPDEIDYANDHAALVLERNLSRPRITAVGIAAFECECCGNPIPEPRRRAVIGCTMCIDCQAIDELKNKHYRSV